MILALILACKDGQVQTDDTGTPPVEIPEDNLAPTLGDCLGHYEPPDEYPNQLARGDELERYTLRDPDALCNDGTPAVMYVRAATDPELADVWSIHLQGGGACRSYASCAVRWCGVGYYDSSKMSSANLPLTIAGAGIFDADAVNLLAGANQAYFYYCSSDSWTGVGTGTYSVDDVELEEGVELPEGLPAAYTMFRRGHTIVEAGLDALEAGLVADDGAEMPPLTGARIVVLNGTSGGSTGARVNADYVRDRLSGAQVYAIFDAANTPLGEHGTATYAEELQARFDLGYTQILNTEAPLPFVDETCAARWGGTADESLCHITEYVTWNHITTPFFMRQDLRDTTGWAEGTSITEDEHEAAVSTMLASLATLPDTAAEGGDFTRTPGAYGPNCAQHVALESTSWWAEATVRDGAGVDWTFQQAVLAWYQGADLSVIDEPVTGEGDGPRSGCADVDTER